MGAKITQFTPRSWHPAARSECTTAFRSPFGPDDLTMGHADLGAPCGNVLSISKYRRESDREELSGLGGATNQYPAVDRAKPGADAGKTGKLPGVEVLTQAETSHQD